MKPDQLWLDLSQGNVRVWMDPSLNLAHARGSSTQRVGFFREIPLYSLPVGSALPMGWSSFAWQDTAGKFGLEAEFWIALEASRYTIFSNPTDHQPLLPPLALDFPLASDVVFFGGTFDPWHAGHEACLNLAAQKAPIIVCPDHNPQKNIRVGAGVQRYLTLMQQIPHLPSVHVYPGFLLKEEANPTVNWVLRVKRNRPDLRVHLLMGFDSFANLSTWNQAGDLMKLLTGIKVVSRGEAEAEHTQGLGWVRAQNERLEVSFLGRHPYENVSSSGLRK